MKSPIHSVAQDSDGDIFIGTEDKGLYIFTSDWKLKKHYLPDSSNNQQTLPISTISALLPGPGNTVFIGTNENGLCLYNKKEQTFTRLNTDNSGLNNNSVRHLTVLSKDSILIGTFRGLNILNTQNMIITPINMDMKAKGALSHYSIHSMLIDRDQTLWVGPTRRSQLSQSFLQASFLYHHQLFCRYYWTRTGRQQREYVVRNGRGRITLL